uniref:BTB domain-containing protein n=1 Tax=Parastrongyloides trichosuri TaxID=131310 RepID=A0A0N4ZV36_PARTI
MLGSPIHENNYYNESIILRNCGILKLIEKIESKGHCLPDDVFKKAEITLNINNVSTEMYKYGQEQCHHYFQMYGLRDNHTFDYNCLESKSDYIRLNFCDGSCIVRKQVLIKYFTKFSEPLSELTDKCIREIMVSKLSVETFRIILKYYYGINVKINLKNVIELYKLCDELQVDGCFKKQVVEYIIKNFVLLTRTSSFLKNICYFECVPLKLLLNNKPENCSFEDFMDIHRIISLYKWKKSRESKRSSIPK